MTGLFERLERAKNKYAKMNPKNRRRGSGSIPVSLFSSDPAQHSTPLYLRQELCSNHATTASIFLWLRLKKA
jgi:hypothetical protein